MEVIFNFMKKNLIKISKKREFKTWSKNKVLDLFRDAEIGLCNEVSRWNAIITWMKHNREQKEIFSEILKCVSFDRLPKDFIKSQIENEPILGEFLHLFQIVSLGMTAHNDDTAYVAVLDSDKKIFAWNILDKTWRHFPDCPSPVVIKKTKMFSFRDKLCILVEGELFYLGKNETKWIPRAALKHRLDQFSTVVSSNNRIYVVEKERMSSYDPDTNTWDESLPGCGLNGKIFAGCTSDRICVRNTNDRKSTYLFREEKWNQIASTKYITTNGAMASYDEKIFVVGLDTSAHPNHHVYAECFNIGWKDISNTPVAINNPCHLFFVDERLFLLMSGILYHYVDIFNDKWIELGSLPQYTCLGMSKNLDPVTVCSFRGKLKITSTANV